MVNVDPQRGGLTAEPSLPAPAPAIRGRRAGLTAGVVLAVVLAGALIGPWIAPHPSTETVGLPYQRPGGGWWLGTDHLGRDVWSKILHGGRTVVLVPLLATVAATVAGLALGTVLAAGRRGTWLLRRLLDVLVAVPALVVLLLALYQLESRTASLVVTVLITTTPYVARFTSATAGPVLASGYVEYAVATGVPRHRVLRREVLPNIGRPVLADAGVRFVGAVYLAAAAGFLGFGTGGADWGSLIGDNLAGARLNPWAVAAPCAAIGLLTISANLLADRLVR